MIGFARFATFSPSDLFLKNLFALFLASFSIFTNLSINFLAFLLINLRKI
nr:MAG TPA: hypothetical protein [Caudoviricetes sp.]